MWTEEASVEAAKALGAKATAWARDHIVDEEGEVTPTIFALKGDGHLLMIEPVVTGLDELVRGMRRVVRDNGLIATAFVSEATLLRKPASIPEEEDWSAEEALAVAGPGDLTRVLTVTVETVYGVSHVMYAIAEDRGSLTHLPDMSTESFNMRWFDDPDEALQA